MNDVAMPRELVLSVHGRAIAAQAWGQPGGTRVLALHGWLDNAASFARLAPLLPDVELVAIDFAGHGLSAHLPDGCWYHYIDSIDEVLGVLAALGWSRAVLLGHSMGAATASLVAATRPDLIEALWLIEALGPLTAEPEQSLSQLRRAHTQRSERGTRGLRTFASLADAVAARQQGVSGLSSAAAMALIERGTRAVPGGWQWSSDPRLTLASPQRATQAQIVACLRGIECPTLVVLAEPAATFLPPVMIAERTAAVADMTVVHLPGTHHVHLEDPEPVAAAIAAFRARAYPRPVEPSLLG